MTGNADRTGDGGLEARLAELEERIAESMDRASELAAKQDARLSAARTLAASLRRKTFSSSK